MFIFIKTNKKHNDNKKGVTLIIYQCRQSVHCLHGCVLEVPQKSQPCGISLLDDGLVETRMDGWLRSNSSQSAHLDGLETWQVSLEKRHQKHFMNTLFNKRRFRKRGKRYAKNWKRCANGRNWILDYKTKSSRRGGHVCWVRPGKVTLSFTVLPLSKIGEANYHFSFFFHFFTKKMY